jgi:hypothetical protein
VGGEEAVKKYDGKCGHQSCITAAKELSLNNYRSLTLITKK